MDIWKFLCFITIGTADAFSMSVDSSGLPTLMRSEKAAVKEDLCESQGGERCVESRCSDQIFSTADCAATAEGISACPGTQVCQNKSTTGTAQYRCCCPPCA
ncbi:unnamed protein product [Durusdinium trenchii]|uniref:Uncharacterized protein n=1 Tax=Durusdinium trenchii TaxID=1381693 RepID=A0ABP0IS58_9DINO